jgi:hypothetical protein
MLIQYASDLHLNDFPSTTPFSEFVKPAAPILILAGDICHADDPLYETFLRWCSRNWKTILVIAGNHEYFCTVVPRNIASIDREIEAICQRLPNVIYLQGGGSVVIDGVRFVGATLWANVPKDVWRHVNGVKGDYRVTFTNDRVSTAEDTSFIHLKHRERLIHQLMTTEQPIVMITHHLPSFSLVSPEYRGTATVSTYASNCEDLIADPVLLWICGHAHRSGLWRINNVPCAMNTRGYASQVEEGITNYSPSKVFNIDY